MTRRTQNDEGPTDLEWLLAEIDRIKGCAATKDRFRAILRSMAGRRVYFARYSLIHPERVRVARAMLDAGFTATQARAELSAVAEVGRRTAERIVAAALDERAMEHQRAMQTRQMSLDLDQEPAR